jgi:hypothetical protein
MNCMHGEKCAHPLEFTSISEMAAVPITYRPEGHSKLRGMFLQLEVAN